MKIALVLDRFDRARGGLEHWTWQLATWLLGQGHDVHVVAREFSPEAGELGVSPHVIAAATSRTQVAAAAERRLRALRADVVHDTGTGWYFDVLQPLGGSSIADWRQNLRAVPLGGRLRRALTPWRRRRYRQWRALQERQLGSRRGVIIAPSRLIASQLHTLHGVDPARVRVVYNGVDTQRFSPRARDTHRQAIRARLGSTEEVVFLLAAHNPELKGARPALAAMARVLQVEPSARLVFIGRADMRPFLAEARVLGIADRCRFEGFVADPAHYYAAADAYLHPTFYDSCSLTVLEAWASGLPAITTRLNGAAELLEPGRHGFVVDDPRDTAGLAAAMCRLLDRQARAPMAAASRELAEAHSTAVNFTHVAQAYEWARERRAAERWEAQQPIRVDP